MLIKGTITIFAKFDLLTRIYLPRGYLDFRFTFKSATPPFHKLNHLTLYRKSRYKIKNMKFQKLCIAKNLILKHGSLNLIEDSVAQLCTWPDCPSPMIYTEGYILRLCLNKKGEVVST